MPLKKSTITFLQDEVGEQLLHRLEWMTIQPKIIVDVSREGLNNLTRLKKRYSKATIIEADLIATDILALGNHTVDLIFVNLVLPWCLNIGELFQTYRRLLRPEGLLIFSSLGPDTLVELRPAFKQHLLLHLMDMHDLGDALIQARFADPVLDVDYLTVTYSEQKTLINELQKMKILDTTLPKLQLTPTGASIFPLTYEVIYGHAFGPAISVDHVADEKGEIRIPLSHLRRRQ